jgi:YVTN family beta-propeller protein
MKAEGEVMKRPAIIVALLVASCARLQSPETPAPWTAAPAVVTKQGSVTTVDLLSTLGLDVNGIGPVLVMADPQRNRIVAAHTLSSSMSVIDGTTHEVLNIPLAGRALQHLKAESMAIHARTGDVYLVGTKTLHVVSPESGEARAIDTGAQLESVAVDEATGNAWVVGRESSKLGYYDATAHAFTELDWLEAEEKLINVNQTPPPSIRKVVVDGALGRVVAADGMTSTLHLFDAKTGEHLSKRPVPLASGGRWHLAGYDEQTHHLFIVTETAERKVIEAARIDVQGEADVVVKLPEFSEGVGIVYNPALREVYVPYDNHSSVHVVTFEGEGSLDEIAIPAFGNDASAIDLENHVLYVGSWAHGEIDVVDLEARKLVKRIENLGIIPHMFTMAFNPNTNLLYVPIGASAVNGTFGAALDAIDPVTEQDTKIRTGWAPIDLIELPERNSFLVFNNEDLFAEVKPDGASRLHRLPCDYPIKAVHGPEGDVYLSYGPHQSYWPVVYIWGAKDGILTIDADDLSFYDRRIFRQAADMAVDADGVLYFTQFNWGGEEQFLGVMEDGVREFQKSMLLMLGDQVVRENTQRILEYDASADRLYLVRTGEKDGDPSVLQIIDPKEGTVLKKLKLAISATDLAFDDSTIYVSNFVSDTVSAIDRSTLAVKEIAAGDGPLRLSPCGEDMCVINHMDSTLQPLGGEAVDIPHPGRPDNIFGWNGRPVITSHSADTLTISSFDPSTGEFTLLAEQAYPYGDARFDSVNVSFYLTGQFGDAVMSITKGRTDKDGRLWVTDFLSGRLFIIEG